MRRRRSTSRSRATTAPISRRRPASPPCSLRARTSRRAWRPSSRSADPSSGAVSRRLDGAREGVADGRAPLLVAAREPAAALLRGSVRPRLRVHLALRPLLDAVVADRGGRVEPVVDVGLRELCDQARLDGVGCPDAGVAVRLELGAHRTALGALAVVADALEHAELV